jgi:hypothetical protein
MGGLTDVIESSGIIGKIIEAGAPVLASFIGSPLAGIGVSLLAHVFGADPKNVNDVVAKISADPDRVVKIKQLEYDHLDTLAGYTSQDFIKSVDDVQDARKFAVNDKLFMKLLAVIVTVGFFCVLVALFFPLNIQPDAKNLLLLLVGNLSSKWQTIIDYFYGSSRPQSSSQGATK